MLKVAYGMQEVGDLRIVTESNYTTALRQGWEAREQQVSFQDFVSGTNDWLGKASSRGDALDSVTGQQVDLHLLRRWLTDCELNHGEACNSSLYSRSNADLPLVLIDVIDNCLVSASSGAKYFALSYVWGAVDMSPTLLGNYKSRCQKNCLPQQFPNTIADAITLVRALDERYLWVDALCIVQDDPEHKERDIARMDVIYSHAFATVVALHGANADAGLPGMRPGTRSPQQVETLVIDAGSEDLDYSPDTKSAQGRGKVTLHLVATPRPLDLVLGTSCWETRGWTFQERLLSRRCLYFSDRYVYFQCGRWRDKVLSECGINSTPRSKQRANSALEASLSNPLTDLYHGGVTGLDPEQSLAKTFATYVRLVDKYTARKLSCEADIINAFMGTFAALNELFQSDILCGLPVAALDLAMLWAPARRTPRRGHTMHTQGFQNMGSGHALGQPALVPTNRNTDVLAWAPQMQTFDDRVDRRFPSWSWVGWTGPVEYRLYYGMARHLPLPASLIEEFVIVVDGKGLQTIPGRKQQRVALTSQGCHLTSAAPKDFAADKPIASPSLPNVLQFLASTVPLSTFTVSTEQEYISTTDHIHSSSRQAVHHILDGKGKRCGLWWEQAGYLYVGRGLNAEAESKMILVGVSRHDAIWDSCGPYRAEGEIKLFDEKVYPVSGTGSGLINVIAVDLDMGHEFGERITVARIHALAWEEAGPVKRMVRLA